MSVNIPSEHDLELLSAYLDGELSDRDRQHLEQRLIEDASLRSTLNDLRDTVSLLKSLPRLKAPRDFTLDPAAHRSPGFSFYRVLQFSGALGTLAATLLIAFSIFFPADEKESATSLEKDPQSQLAVVPTLAATPLTETAEEEIFTFQATEGEVPAPVPGTPTDQMPPTAMGTPTLMQMHATTTPIVYQIPSVAPQAQPPVAAGAAESSASQPQPLEASGAAAYDAASFPTPTVTSTRTPPPTPTLPGTATPALEREADDEQAENMAFPTEQPSMKATAVAVVPTNEPLPEVPAQSASRREESEETGMLWMAQLGLILLGVSISAFVWGYWKARR